MTDTEIRHRRFFFDTPNPHGAAGTHRIVFYEWGSPYAPAIVCVHGLTRNGRDFDYLARALAADYRVICIDMPGRGQSERLAQVQWYENATYMQDTLALLDYLNIPEYSWIGTSMGGIVGMMIASLVPGKITRLVLNDVGAILPKAGLLRICEYVGARPDFPNREEAESYLRAIAAPFGIKDDTHWRHFFTHSLIDHTDGRVSFAYDPAIGDAFRLAASQMESVEDISLWMLWESISCPALILRGAESDILPHEVAVKMCAMHDNATLVEFAGIGHAPPLMETEQIDAVKTWLNHTH